MYGKLIRKYLKEIEIDTDGLKGTVKITRLKEYEKKTIYNFFSYTGEIDITFKGEVKSQSGVFYDVNRFRPVQIRKYIRRQLESTLNVYVRPFGVSYVKIKNIKLES